MKNCAYDFSHKTVGVWGYGISGRSTVRFLTRFGCSLVVVDKKKISADDELFFQNHKIRFVNGSQDVTEFLQQCDVVIPSPGIDVRPYAQFSHKFIAELDLFQHFFKKPVIAITGSLGKTTVTTLIGKALALCNQRVVVGGNIGVGLFDLIDQQEPLDYAVLEVSSFQLELCQSFSPTLAVWTNLYPNHLDRHASLMEYIDAKKKVFLYQSPTNLVASHSVLKLLGLIKDEKTEQSVVMYSGSSRGVVTVRDHDIVNRCDDVCEIVSSVTLLDRQGFRDNWLLVIAVLSRCGFCGEQIRSAVEALIDGGVSLEHRLEYVATVGGIDFINDSKSTVVQATLAAVDRFQDRPLILLLGGFSKGVDRSPFVASLANKVAHVVCFGGESEALYQRCVQSQVPASSCKTMEEAIALAMNKAQPGYRILLSPSGSSFDLFSNYKERGNKFKQYVFQLPQ